MTGDHQRQSDDWQDSDLISHAQIIAQRRRLRANFLPEEIFGEPAWDMLLDLFVASVQGKLISVSSACIASRAPATTALRWLNRMEQLGLVERVDDRNDGRRVHVKITAFGRNAVGNWLNEAVI